MRKLITVLAACCLLLGMALPAAAADLELTLPGASKGQEIPLPAGKTIRMVFKAGMSPEGECSYYVRPSQEAVGGAMRRTAVENLSLSGCQASYSLSSTDKVNIKCTYKITDTSKDASFTYLNDSNGTVFLSLY